MRSANRLGTFVRTYLAVGAAISLLAIIQTQIQTQALLKLRTRYKWALLMAIFAVNLAVGLYVAIRGTEPRMRIRFPVGIKVPRAGARVGAFALLLLPVPVFLMARQDFFGRELEGFFRLLWTFWWLALVQASGLRLGFGWPWPRAMAAAMLIDGFAAQLFTLSTGVSAYPFSMGWSEASRYYYGSLVFAGRLYGEVLPLSVMHGSRYLLQSVPFLMAEAPLWSARLWQVLLWIGLTGSSAWALVRRLGIRARANAVLVATWLFLFFFQGAVYYHLQVSVIVVLLGVRTRQPGRSLVAVVLASIWAGMSRVNWFPVPAMLAIAIYLLETPYDRRGGLRSYLRIPALWGIAGIVSALVGQALYVAISGNSNLAAFASSFTSALLWYRWWPSATNPIGIIPGVVIVSAPVWAVIAWRLRDHALRVHWLRAAALGAMLLVLLAVGLVVSTKIGGGGDLHNMDAYLVLLAWLGAYSLKGSVQDEDQAPGRRQAAPWSIVAPMVLIPVALALLRMGEPFVYDPIRANADLNSLRQEVLAQADNREVLFLYERHLQAFDLVPRIKLVPEYEVVTLMEMAISGNETYLSHFYDDLRNHRFSAIVSHPQNLGVETGDFIEENDAWNTWVARPLLCQYKPGLTLEYSKVQVLVPRDRPCPDFPPQFVRP